MIYSPSNLSSWIAINHIPYLTPQEIQILLPALRAEQDVISMTPTKLKKMNCTERLIQKIKNVDPTVLTSTQHWLEQEHHHVLTLYDKAYPKSLRTIAYPPLLLYLWGEPTHLQTPQIAIVGSRHPTPMGLENTMLFSNALSQAGLTITSGLAIGIDTAAHEGALFNQGKTIAVLGSGLNNIYPTRNKALAEKITSSGALLSEFPLQTPPRPENFPRRNRIMSGLSLGVLVIEATLPSGSLITAYSALEQGKEVFALPGSIHNPLSKGCHSLIQKGAKLVETLSDILEELPPGTYSQISSTVNQQAQNDAHAKSFHEKLDFCTLNYNYSRVLQSIGYETTTVEHIVERSQLKVHQVLSILVLLEAQGHVKSIPGGYCRMFRQEKDE